MEVKPNSSFHITQQAHHNSTDIWKLKSSDVMLYRTSITVVSENRSAFVFRIKQFVMDCLTTKVRQSQDTEGTARPKTLRYNREDLYHQKHGSGNNT
jgi:hypothetical protein